MALTLHQLELFVALAKCLSMTRLSKEMHVSQSAISHQIKRLQRDFGRPLIKSRGRGVALTAEGTKFLRHAKAVLSRIDGLYRKPSSKT